MADMITKDGRVREFAEWICELAHGEVNQRLSEKLGQLSAAVNETGKKGKLAIAINVEKEGDRAVVSVDIKATMPEHPIHGTLFFFGDASLHRDNPKQMKFSEPSPIRPVQAAPDARPPVPSDFDDGSKPPKGA